MSNNGIAVNLRASAPQSSISSIESPFPQMDQFNVENGFERFSFNEVRAGFERMAYAVFFKTTNCWRIGDVSATKFKPVSPKVLLPMGSIVHLFDNFSKIEMKESISDIPSFDYPFIKNENFRKYIYHQLVPLTDGMIKTPNDYIYRTMQLQKNIERFRSQNSGKYLTVKKLEPLNMSGPYLGIINHNPTFRLFVRGQLPYWRALEHILASMFNLVKEIPNKSHYFIVPLTPKIFTKGKFQQSSMRITTGSLQYKDSYQYMFFVQLYNFLNEVCTVKTVFDSIDQELWSKINLVFQYGEDYLFWTLKDLKELNIRNQIYTRIFNHFNGFIVRGVAKEMLAQVNVLEEDETNSSDTNVITQSTNIENSLVSEYSKLTKIPIEELASEQEISVDPDLITKQEAQDFEKLLKSINGVNFEMGNRETILDATDVSAIIEQEEPIEVAPVVEDTEINKDLSQQENVIPETVAIVPYYQETELETITLPNANYTPYQTTDQIGEMGEQFLERIDMIALHTIKKDQTLTVAQKERATRMAVAYKDITIGGTPIVKLMTEKIDPIISNSSMVTQLEGTIDKGMLSSTIVDIDREYMQKLFLPHLVSIAASMSAHGMYLQDIEEKETNTELTQMRDFVFRYKTTTGKQHSTVFSMPIIRDDGTFMINGIRSSMCKQLYNKPITKISETRVSLASNYNKTIVEKISSNAHEFSIYLNNVIDAINDVIPRAIHVEYGTRKFSRDADCGIEYLKIAKRYSSITIIHQKQQATSYLYFGDQEERKQNEYVKFMKRTGKDWEEIAEYEKTNHCIFLGMKVGTAAYSGAYYYMDRGSRLLMVGTQDGQPFKIVASILDLIQGATGYQHSKQLTEWVDIKIMDGKFPVGFLLCYRFGLLTMLRRLNVKYKIVNTRSMKNEEISPTDIIIKFADNKGIVFPRYPLKTSLIFQGLVMFNTKLGAIEEYDQKDIYFRLLMDKRKGTGRTNYLIGIDDTFDMFIDRMTYDRLVQMGEPTTFEGLLIRATEMLVVPYHKEAAAMANHCLRTYERMNGILYNEMTSQFRQYRKQRGSAATFSINPNAVLQRIIQDQSVQQVEDINPIHDIKMTTKVTYLGMGGRTMESFTVPDRRYPVDGAGMLSEATPDSGNVAITAQASMNPILENVYGLIKQDQNPEDLDPSQLLSVTALLMPCATQDDQHAYI